MMDWLMAWAAAWERAWDAWGRAPVDDERRR